MDEGDEIYMEIDTLVEKLPKTKDYIRELEQRSKDLEEKNIDLERKLNEERKTTASQAGLLAETRPQERAEESSTKDDVIQNANMKINKLEEGLQSISTLVNDSQNYIKNYLEENYHQLENSLRSETLKSELIEDSIELSLNKLQDFDQRRETLQRKIAKTNEDCTFKRNQKSDLEESIQTAKLELAEMQREYDIVDAKKTELEDILSTSDKNDGKEDFFRRLQKHLTRYEGEKRQLKRHLANQMDEITELQILLSENSSELGTLENQLSKFQDQDRKLEENISLEKQSNEHRKTQQSMSKETMRNIQSHISKLNDKKEEFEKNFSKKEEDSHQIRMSLNYVTEVIHTIDDERLELKRKVAMLEEQLKIKTDAAQVINISLENANTDLEKLGKECDVLKEKRQQRRDNIPAVERSLTQFQKLLTQTLIGKTAELMATTSQEIQTSIDQACQKETKEMLNMYMHDGNCDDSTLEEERLRSSADCSPDGSNCSEDVI